MNNDELKKKIAQIIAEYCCPLGKTHKQLYGDERQCYSEMNFAECKPITECTDALIAAWIGDVIDEFVKNIMTEAEPFLSNMSRNLIRMCASKMKKELAAEARLVELKGEQL